MINYVVAFIALSIGLLSLYLSRRDSPAVSTALETFNRASGFITFISFLLAILLLVWEPFGSTISESTDVPILPTDNIWTFDFDSSTQNWTTSESQYKEATLEVGSTKYTGNSSLLLSTELRYDSEDHIFQHTEATGYFNTAIPQGAPTAGPYDLTGKLVSCWVYVPINLAVETGNPQSYIQLFVKDVNNRNEFGAYEDIITSNTDQWMQLSFQVNSVGSDDPSYDSTQINALGIRIHLQDSATLTYSTKAGDPPIYIDACTIEAP